MAFAGKAIQKVNKAPMVQADVTGAPAGTLGAYLNTLLKGTDKLLTLPAIAAATDGVKASNTTYGDASSPSNRMAVSVGSDVEPQIGDGVKTKAFYWSADGVAARALTAVISTDFLYVNTSILGYPLEVGDTIYVSYRS